MGVEFLRHEGFLHIVVDTESIARLHIVGRSQGRGKDDDHVAVSLTDALHHLEAVHHRHVDIGDDHVGVRLLPGFQPFLAVRGGGHFIAADDVFEAGLLDISQRSVVFNKQ